MSQETRATDWLPWISASLLISHVHVIIYYHSGLYGPSGDAMTPLQAVNTIFTAAAFAWWLVSVGWAASIFKFRGHLP